MGVGSPYVPAPPICLSDWSSVITHLVGLVDWVFATLSIDTREGVDDEGFWCEREVA